jgi:hypothetical protein
VKLQMNRGTDEIGHDGVKYVVNNQDWTVTVPDHVGHVLLATGGSRPYRGRSRARSRHLSQVRTHIQRKIAMSQGGYYFKLDPSSGRFFPIGDVGLGGSPGDGCLCVTGILAIDVHQVAIMINDGCVAIPSGSGRWQVSYQALLNAQQSGNRAVLVPTTA